VIDLHCHVLPGIDDGPKSIAAARGLARAAYAAGVRTLVATPHVSWHYPNRAATIGPLVDELRAQLTADGIELDLRAGAEVAVTYLDELDHGELSRLRLGGGEWLLVEPPFAPLAPGLDDALAALQRGGHRILLAHPERCAAFHHDPEMLASIVRRGALTSITAGSLVGRFGGVPQRFALKLVEEGMVHNVASDAHDLPGRTPGMAVELEQAGLQPLAQWLTCDVPAAILGGGEIPRRPHVGHLGPRPARARWGARRWRLRR
jgi:protein-tyrosine phosphatase